jgi:DNA replication and repair protein RecF
MELRKLITWQFRNLESSATEPEPGLNLIFGSNGHGKTNFLEAVAVVGNIRSFRQASVRKMVCHGHHSFRLEAWVGHGDHQVHLRQIVECSSPAVRRFEINGVVVGLDQYLLQFPVFTLSAADTALVTGSPDQRRAFLDRMAFFFDSRHLEDLNCFKRSLRQRNAALSQQTTSTEMEIWEENLARAAAEVVDRRIGVIQHWEQQFQSMYQFLRVEGFPNIEVTYRGEAPMAVGQKETVANFYRERYYQQRARDCRMGFTLDGPHRHDLVLKADGHPVRDVLSAGQVKIVAAALWMSNLAQVEEQRNERFLVLVDDADAELDTMVFGKLVESFGHRRQVMMTSAHDRSFGKMMPAAARWSMVNGTIQRNTCP